MHPLISAIRRTQRHGSGVGVFPVFGIPTSLLRSNSGSAMSRPSPPRLPQAQQREFEELHRAVQELGPTDKAEALHPDARRPIPPEFEGSVNPVTGEEGGPKQEPVGRWGEDHGDWSLKGRVSDF